MKKTLVAVATLVISVSALAGEPARRTTIGVGMSGETLGDTQSGNRANWREKSVRVRRDIARRTVAEFGVSNTRRFGLSDRQFGGTLVWPMGEKVTASVDATYSDTRRVLPRRSVGATVQYEFKPAWQLRGGVRTTSYREDKVRQGVLALERGFTNHSVTASWQPTRVFGVTAHSYALQGAWYYGERDSVALTVATGREATPAAAGVVLGKVESVGLGGRHALSQAWAANYGVSYTRQPGLYTRKGVSAALAYSY